MGKTGSKRAVVNRIRELVKAIKHDAAQCDMKLGKLSKSGSVEPIEAAALRAKADVYNQVAARIRKALEGEQGDG